MAVIALISVATLQQLGLFDGTGAKLELPTAAGTLVVEFDKSRQVICFKSNDPQTKFSTSVSIKFEKLKFGLRPYFLCPQSGRRCLALIFDNGEVFCSQVYLERPSLLRKRQRREGLRLAKSMDRQVAAALSGKLSSERASQLRELAGVVQFPPAVCQKIEHASAEASKARPKQLWNLRPLGTIKAIECGRGAGQFTIYERYIEQLPEFYVSIVPEQIYPPETEPGTLDCFAAFDIRVLADRFGFEEHTARAQTLGWPSCATSGETVLMIMDLRDMAAPMIMMARIASQPTVDSWQRLKLQRNSSGRWYFVCPARSERCEILYFRNGLFASRGAHRLYHPSQRAYGRRRYAEARASRTRDENTEMS